MEDAKKSKTPLCGSSNNPYDNIIPHNAKKVPKGKYIYSRVDFGQKKRNQVQETLYPSFFVGKHPNANLCIPCCFNVPTSAKQRENREKCGAIMWEPRPADATESTSKAFSKSKKDTNIIKEGNKFPIDAGHWGFLPPNVYNFLCI